MPKFEVIQGGRNRSFKGDTADYQYFQEDEAQFGPPPSLLFGFMTSLIGAAAGFVSLIIYFVLFNPASDFSADWLLFVVAGAAAGFFLRFERTLVREIQADSD